MRKTPHSDLINPFLDPSAGKQRTRKTVLQRKIEETHPDLITPLLDPSGTVLDAIAGAAILIRDRVRVLMDRYLETAELAKDEWYWLTGIFLKTIPQTVRLEDQRDSTKSPFDEWLDKVKDARVAEKTASSTTTLQ